MKRHILGFLILLAVAVPGHAQFKATGIATENALSSIRRQAAATKLYLISQRALMVAPTVNSTVPLAVVQHLAAVITTITALSGTPGLSQYAKDQLNAPTYDVIAEYTAMRAAMVNVRNSLTATFPKDQTGTYLAYQSFDANGFITTRTFTAPQVAAAVALIDSLIATIE